jgi:Zn-dependent protease
MFGRSITLFRVSGIRISIHASWFIIAVLLTWTLARGIFPDMIPVSLPLATYWVMGVAGALGLFGSIILHELGHAIVGRQNGLRIRGITLFIFGGVAELESEPPTPNAELKMAIAGPIVSILLSAIFFALWALGTAFVWPIPISGVFRYLGGINALLVAFNMIPAFPLDGGRVLRSILWGRRNDLHSATRTSAKIGSGFGTAFIMLGIFGVLTGNFVGGMWWFLIGMFLRGASQMSYQQVEIRKHLEGEPISRFMTRDPVTVPPTISVESLVQDYIYRFRFHEFPVMDDGRLYGCAGIKEVKEVNRADWPHTAVGEILTPSSPENTVSVDTDAIKALSKMSRNGVGRLMVLEGRKLKGIVSLRDLVRFLSVKLDLESSAGGDSIQTQDIKELQGV